ncbi:bifunctional diaminohydroxyphosphoribosylaminopyrimidine deaminase/5-amino-6-(5-phosphoribosylamino)uracil reductase RibD [Paenibacillus sp. N1-5-1-14]|uniref:bifunctional diaminohydroxyphosphoribosylaminopyrimidine deaminase/5-amino-6-(5-phosphoribosylamino)uracil reductase RibD n=1 Tax=Paenibacillus radicibacter TaxID=2972488 RepID=UPI00215980A4|nr:bifunctional diaminohydroxyphosphoribosylaminopyrimidine deaminase/5-amino-6-(5-phosphoribosylamino)uracil reductase RibD [Paenibacillus radicibacter]MCR8642350.1 bifunctional diaminohydroxyphosphoribosylaminopyrimidine deaminase/5-amino-6-(5-phosphoribosylamino)uracil reductase RibD [Paenibacillus radicibacter]
MDILNDAYYMRLALQLAGSAQGQTGINPVVGCVLVKDGRIVGMGAHLKRGQAHAEINALQMAGSEAAGSTAYVTLEPCSHYGKTPPCSNALMERGIKRVVVASVDPNPCVAGTGLQRMRDAGIEVTTGVLADEAAQLNEVFNKFIVTGMPWVTLKTAATLDGRIASKTGDSKWITGEASRAYVHMLRHQHGAIMVGAGTVRADDPSLSTRLSVPALQPVRVLVDGALSTPSHSKALQGQGLQRTIVLTTAGASAERRAELEALGVEVVTCGDSAHVDLPLALRELGKRDIASILLEGGGGLNGAMLEARLIDKMVLFYAPIIIGGEAAPANFTFRGFERMSEAIRLKKLKVEQFGEDVCLTGYPHYEDNPHVPLCQNGEVK